MREITTHHVNGCNEALKLTVLDGPGSGGAHHHYLVSLPAGAPFPYSLVEIPPELTAQPGMLIVFQNGPIKEAGINGLTQEVLLAIIQDRLEKFQEGPYACDDNAEALEHIKKAQEVLQRRTKARLARGVEGTHTV